MSDLYETNIEDLAWEHEAQHTSDDWENLKNRCSECYRIIKSRRQWAGKTDRPEYLTSPFDKSSPWDPNPLE